MSCHSTTGTCENHLVCNMDDGCMYRPASERVKPPKPEPTERAKLVHAAEQHPHIVVGRLFDKIEAVAAENAALAKRVESLERSAKYHANQNVGGRIVR